MNLKSAGLFDHITARIQSFFADAPPATEQAPPTASGAAPASTPPIEQPPAESQAQAAGRDPRAALMDLLESGNQDSEAILEQLIRLCDRPAPDTFTRSNEIRRLEMTIARLIHPQAASWISHYGQYTFAEQRYKMAIESIRGNHIDQVAPPQHQRFLVLALLVVTELVYDYNKLNANHRHHTRYTDKDLLVMAKPDNVRKLFSDAERVIAPLLAQAHGVDEHHRTGATTSVVLNADVRQRLENQRITDEVKLRDRVTATPFNLCAQGFGATFDIESHDSVRVTWDRFGKVTAIGQRDPFKDFRTVSTDTLAELTTAGILSAQEEHAAPTDQVPVLTADTRKRLEDAASHTVHFSSDVSASDLSGLGATFSIASLGGAVHIQWDRHGSITSIQQGNVFTGYTPVSVEALDALRQAGVLQH